MKNIFLVVLLFSFTVLSAQTDSIPQSALPENDIPPGEYVIFAGDTLFNLHAPLGPYSAKERVSDVSRRLANIASDMVVVEDSFNIVETADYSTIRYKEYRIVSLSDQDALYAGADRQIIAEEYLHHIKDSFEVHIESKTFSEWMESIGYTLLTLLGLVIIIYLLNRMFKWVDKKLTQYEKSIKRERRSILRYLSPKGPEYFFQFIFNIIRYALIFVIILLYLPLLFNFLPWTRGIVQTFYSYIANPITKILIGLYDFLPDLFFIVIIIVIARYIVRVLSYMSAEVEDEHLKIKGFHRDWAKPTLNIAKVIVYAFAIVFMFPYLPGSDSEAFKGVSIFLGILFSLGSTSAIANIVAGIVITYMRPFMIGDRVRIGETVGDVVEKTMLVTRIRTLKNEDVTIPNATIISGHLWNYTKNAKELGVILHTSITLGYDVPWKEVNRLLLLAAKNTKNLTRDFKPFVLQKSLNDFYVEYELNVYTKQPGKMMHFYSELHKNILEVFNEAGIEILSPHYQSMRDGNASTIPGVEPPVPDTRNPIEKIIDTATGNKE
jgi:small-conductance mechanosensitive channel